MAALASSPEFVGRAAELAGLEAALGRATAGRAAAVVVGGESGVGKTRLVAELCGLARARGAIEAVGGCVDLGEGGLPYWPVVDAFRSLARRLGPDAADDLLGDRRADLALLLPDLAAAAPGGARGFDGPTAQTRLFEGVLRVLDHLGRRAPVVLVLEDLHWADRSTRDLLSFLLANLREQRVLLVATYRSDAVFGGHHLQPLLAELRRNRRAELVDVLRFTREELGAQLAAILGEEPRPELADAIWSRSDGNAFFAEELVAAAVDSGTGDLPPSLRQILLARVDGLSAEAQDVLRLVAAGGPRVPHALLAASAPDGDDRLLLALRECVDHQVLLAHRDTGDYTFRHALMRDVVYGELLPGERSRFHAAYGRAVAADPGLLPGSAEAALAHHWHQAGDAGRALPAAVAAAGAAERVYGFAESQRHYERALELWERVADAEARAGLDRLGLYERAAEAANLAGDHRRAVALARAALSAGEAVEPLRAALLHERLGAYLWAGGESEAALGAYDEAARLVPPDEPTAERARVVAAQAQALMLAGRYRESRQRAEEALDVARRASARAEEGHVLATLGFDLAFLGHPSAGVSLLEEARAIAEEVGTPDDVGRAWLNLAELLSGPLNRLHTAAEVAEQGVERARRLGLERSYGVSLQAIAGNTLFRLGRWAEADRFLDDALRCHPGGAAAIDLHLARAKLSVGRGEVAAARADLAVLEELIAHAIDARYAAPLLTLRAGLALWEGEVDDARRAVATGLAGLAHSDDTWFLPPLVWHGLRAEADRAETARALRATTEADHARAEGAALLARVQRLAEQSADAARPVRQAMAAYLALCRAEWSRVEAISSPQAWGVAAARWDELGQPYPGAYARYRQAEALLGRRARSPEATAALQSAHRVATDLGAAPFRRQIEELAVRGRVPLDPPPAPAAEIGPCAAVPAPSSPSSPPSTPSTTLSTNHGYPTPAPGGGHPSPAPGGGHPDDASASRSGAAAGGVLAELTPRERDVLVLVAEGRSNREVAAALFISEKTASVHVSHILAKLGVQSRVQASAVAHRLGAVRPGG
ncbi:MAG: AAA family ATPase [Acidimicrobiales bacterium]